MSKLESFKYQFRKRVGIALNNAGISPISESAANATIAWTDRLQREGLRAMVDAETEVERTRRRLADFLQAAATEIAFFPTTAAAISQVALGFSLRAGDEILVWDQEYPSNFYPWAMAAKRSGAKLVVVKSPADLSTPATLMIEHATPRTRLMAFSWVQYRTGAMAELDALTSFARARGIFTCADIIQGAGVIPFDFQNSGLDAACGGSHKWMSSPLGVGYLVLKRQHVELLEPLAVGALSFGSTEELPQPTTPLKTDMGRFEPGAKNLLGLVAFGAALQLLSDTGIETVYNEAHRLAERLARALKDLGYTIHSPGQVMVNVGHSSKSGAKSAKEISQRLTDAGIGHALRPPGIRLSPHAFNSDEDIEHAVACLR